MSRLPGEAILFELMRSFTSLARTLNISATVRDLGTTRQTVRRHIDILEEYKGVRLFKMVDRQYELTDHGRHSIREAEELLARGKAWLEHRSGHVEGLHHLANHDGKEFSYHLQQHPLGRLWESGSPIMRNSFLGWAEAQGQLEHTAFAPMRPYTMIFRLRDNDWICVEVGDQSSFATWFGWEWERSSVGRGLADLPAGTGFANLMAQPFHHVLETEGFRFDHIHTQLARGPDRDLTPISYQRLLLGMRFPDGTPAIAAIIARTYDLVIQGLDKRDFERMPADLVMKIAS